MAAGNSFQNYHMPSAEPGNNYNFAYRRPTQNIDHYYNLENVPKEKTFVCETCNASFFTHFMFKKHVSEHVQCPFPECKLTANMKVIDQHITHQHLMVNFEALQIDDEAWITQRKKQFPSVERAKLRMAEQLERNKRGERLGKDKRKFGKTNSNNEGSASDKNNYRKKGNYKDMKGNKTNIRKERNSKFKKGNDASEIMENYSCSTSEVREQDMKEFDHKTEFRNQNNCKETTSKWKRDNQVPMPVLNSFNSDSDDSDPEDKFGIPAFKGTQALFENTGEISLFGVQNAEKQTYSAADQHPSMEISDEEEWDDRPNTSMQVEEEKITLNNALGSLIGAYGSESESDLDDENKAKPSCNLTGPQPEVRNAGSNETNEDDMLKKGNEELCTPISNCTANQNSNIKKHYGKRKRRHMPRDNSKRHNRSRDSNQTFPATFNAPKPYRRRHTLLEKLLKPDIVHERNVILQCIRYIVENNFFDPLPNPVDNKNTLNEPVDNVPLVETVDKLTLNEPEGILTVNETEGKLSVNETEGKLTVNEAEGKLSFNEPESKISLNDHEAKLSLNEPADMLSVPFSE